MKSGIEQKVGVSARAQDRIVWALLGALVVFGLALMPQTVVQMYTFDSVADLATFGNPQSFVFRSCYTRGYYAPGDGGGGQFFPTNSVTSTNFGTRIKAAGSGWSWDRLYQGNEIDARWFGAMGVDGTVDDSGRLQSASTVITSGKTLVMPGVHLLHAPGGTNALITWTGLTNIGVRGRFVDTDLSMTAPDWVTISSLVSTGTVAYATTATAHGFTAGRSVTVYCSGVREYKGTVVVLASGLDATHFGYNTLGGTPAGAGSGTMQAANVDYESGFFRFVNCRNPKFDLEFTGPNRDRSFCQRRGRYVARLDDNGGTTDNIGGEGKLKVYGAAYGIWVGYYQSARLGHWINPTIDIDAENTGYPLASWGGCEGANIRIRAWDVHRGCYSTAARRWTGKILAGNFDIAGWINDTHLDSGPEGNDMLVEDIGTTDDGPSFWAGALRYLYGVEVDTGGTPTCSGKARLRLKVTDSIGRNIVAFHMGTLASAAVIDGIVVSAEIDRTGVTSTNNFQVAYGTFVRPDPAELRNLVFRDFQTRNSATAAASALFKRDIVTTNLTGRLVFDNAETDSQANISIAGTGRILNRDAIYSLAGSQTVTRFADPSTMALNFSAGGGAIFPASPGGFDEGSPAARFRDLYAARNVWAQNTTLAIGSEPAASTTNAVLWVDTSAGKAIFKVRFPTGASQAVATEP